MSRRLCAWVSRHAPLSEHRVALMGYDIRQVKTRELDVSLAWLDILSAGGLQVPDLVVLITGHERITPMVLHLARVASQAVVVRPVMQPGLDGEWYWSGRWRQYIVVEKQGRMGTVQEDWTPEGVRS